MNMNIEFTKEEIITLGRTLPLFLENLQKQIELVTFKKKYYEAQNDFLSRETPMSANVSLIREELLNTLPNDETLDRMETSVKEAVEDLEHFKKIYEKVERYSSLFLDLEN